MHGSNVKARYLMARLSCFLIKDWKRLEIYCSDSGVDFVCAKPGILANTLRIDENMA
ncbi:hypothetical protein [Paramagnetospirillum kuznetsovii]|uniref:hypothetical protein n=1 Tax=Paramagnetospirillum kuznetsovii TaxID=2053833 RepID=UPI001374AAFE|nr:hypothetical protein [Paramagnetospirillum kuznetsovii]